MGEVKVRVHTGALDATDALARVPPDRWAELVQVRRSFLTTNLPYDCRCLLQFVAEATPMLGPLGYTDTTDFLRRGLELDPEMVGWALKGLKQLKPGEPIPYTLAVLTALNAAPDLQQTGRPKKGSDSLPLPKGSTSAARLAAKLKRHHPDICARIQAGEFSSMRAAAIAAGIIKIKSPLEQLRTLWVKTSPEDRLTFLLEVRVS